MMGWFVAHEISHLLNFPDPETNIGRHKVNCLIEQYSSYLEPITHTKLNGNRTIYENIADNVGLEIAYKTYKKISQNDTELRLPGLNFSADQLFWISAAQSYCTGYGEERLKYVLSHKEQSLSPFRVMGSMRNILSFSNDFSCPKHSPMNPEPKCLIF